MKKSWKLERIELLIFQLFMVMFLFKIQKWEVCLSSKCQENANLLSFTDKMVLRGFCGHCSQTPCWRPIILPLVLLFHCLQAWLWRERRPSTCWNRWVCVFCGRIYRPLYACRLVCCSYKLQSQQLQGPYFGMPLSKYYLGHGHQKYYPIWYMNYKILLRILQNNWLVIEYFLPIPTKTSQINFVNRKGKIEKK